MLVGPTWMKIDELNTSAIQIIDKYITRMNILVDFIAQMHVVQRSDNFLQKRHLSIQVPLDYFLPYFHKGKPRCFLPLLCMLTFTRAEAQVQRLETRIGQIEHNQSRLSELQLGLEEKLAETEIDADALEIDYRLMQELLDANLKDVKDLRNERQEYIEKIASLRDCLGILQGREIFSAQKADFSELKDLGKRLEEELAQNHRPKLPGSNGVFYTVEKKAGAGRMGSVFQATRSSDGTLVVVKVITDPTLESLLRFTRENHIILNLEHDCIMKGIDCVQQRYLIYSVAEFVEGQNLSDYIADHTRAHSHSIASSVVLDVAGGLEYLAGKEIVHRDIKPDNIMITSEGKAKIIDFGIATHPDFEATLAPDFLMGAPNYMAPERFVDQCDTRSDIYALGVIYYRMTTGKLPYTAPSLGQLMKKIAKGKFISPRKLNPEISQAEDSLISKMIQRKAIQRFQSPAELLNALENLQKENNS